MTNKHDPKQEPELELIQAKVSEPTRVDLLRKVAELEIKVDEVLKKIRERNKTKRKAG